ncbi:Rv3235 family protein [Streptomyces sp. 549]|nr:Rv3235 family protein [Streptomyces sp. 549]MDK1476825.1 Rv3235 family protein [Streptomyces sp. 549]
MTTATPQLPRSQLRPHRTPLRLTAPHRFAEHLLLVLSGRRPVHSLLGHMRGHAYDQVSTLASVAPLRPRRADQRTAVLASVHSQTPCAGVIEVCARISTSGRDRALAFRLEHDPDTTRWRCSAVHLG